VNQHESTQNDGNGGDVTRIEQSMREVAIANGFNSIGQAIAEAVKWRRAQQAAFHIIKNARQRERHYASQPESRHINRMKDFQVGKVAGILELFKRSKEATP
jgi:hypothetical protein